MSQSDNSEASAPQVTLRPLVVADVAPLVALWVAAWQETMPAIDFAARAPFITAVLREHAEGTIVAADVRAALGFACLEGAYLHQLVVAPAAMGRGVGRRLVEAAKTRAATGLSLDVNIANERAVRFYRRAGFVVVAEGRNAASGLATYAMRWSP